MTKNIFDIDNLDDLSSEVTKELRKGRERSDAKKMASLFELKSILTCDEIIVGLSRKYSINKTRSWVQLTAGNLNKRNIIKKADNTMLTYQKVYESK